MILIRTILAVSLVVMGSIAQAQSQSNLMQATATQSSLDQLGRSIVKQKCSQPQKFHTKPTQNQHDPSVSDEIQTYSCHGFDITLYKANAVTPFRELPLSLEMYSSHPKLGKRLSVGASALSVRAELGAPQKMDGENLVYDLSETMDDTVTFKVSHDRVKSIVWSWDVD